MNFSTLTLNVTTTDTFYQTSSDLDDGVWYWRVRAKDDAGNWGYWSAIWWFIVDTVEVPELNKIAIIIPIVVSFSAIALGIRKKKQTYEKLGRY